MRSAEVDCIPTGKYTPIRRLKPGKGSRRRLTLLIHCLYGVCGCGRRNEIPPARETPPGPAADGSLVWPSPTKRPLVGVSPIDAPMPNEVWCVPAFAYDWPNVPLMATVGVIGKSAPTVPNIEPREKYPADP